MKGQSQETFGIISFQFQDCFLIVIGVQRVAQQFLEVNFIVVQSLEEIEIILTR